MKKFIVGRTIEGKSFIEVDNKYEMPFNVSMDLLRLSGYSYHGRHSERFEFLLLENLEKGKQVLIGANV